MKKIILNFVALGCLFLTNSSCNKPAEKHELDSQKTYDLGEPVETPDFTGLRVNKIEFGKDGYMAYLSDDQGDKFSMIVSVPNLGKNYVKLEVGDHVNVNGDLTEGEPNHIFPKEIILVK